MANENNQVEIWEDEDYEEYVPQELPGRRYTFKCKPCYNFQSIEFEYEGTEDDLPHMMELYGTIVQMLQDIAPEQVGSKMPPKEPATENQIKLLKKLGVNFSKNLSKDEARKLIAKEMSAND